MSKQGTENRGRELKSLADRRWRRKDAEAVLAGWKESGLSLSRFAAERGVNVQRLSWWRKQLERTGRGGRGRPEHPAAVSFIPGVVSASRAAVVVRLPRGVEVEVAEAAAVPAAWLAATVKALEDLR